MATIIAPHELPETSLFLADPEIGDGNGLAANLIVKTMIDGTMKPYYQYSNTRSLELTFVLTQEETDWLIAFLDEYVGDTWRIYFKDDIWIVKLTTNIITITCGYPNNSVTLSFVGKLHAEPDDT